MKDYSEMIDIFIKLRNFTLELRAYSIKHNIPMLELFNDVEVQ